VSRSGLPGSRSAIWPTDRLRVRAFINDAARNRLNAIMQPAIHSRLLQQLQAAPPKPYRLLSAPLLLENELDVLCDLVLVVDVSAATQLSRGSQRDRQRRDAIAAIRAVWRSSSRRAKLNDTVLMRFAIMIK